MKYWTRSANLRSFSLMLFHRKIGKLIGCCRNTCQLRYAASTATMPLSADAGSLPQLPPCDFQPKPYKGMSYEQAVKTRQEKLSPGYLTYYQRPVMLYQGHMQYLWDVFGKRYLDLFGGIVTVSVGHCHPKVNAALEEQLGMLWHLTNIYMHPKIHEYIEKLTAKLPEHLKVCFICNSGSDANDLAMVMARLYTGRYDIVTLRNAYHGASPYCISLTASSNWKFNLASGFGVHHAVNPDVYRGPWGGAYCRDSPSQTLRSCDCGSAENCKANEFYVDQLYDLIKHSCNKQGPAAFFAESIQGVGGTVQFPRKYMKNAYELVREKGGVCIADEVQTGFGRTGEHYWGFQMNDVVPDIVTMAKGIGNGFPLAAVVTTTEIASTLGKALYFNTYGGNPLSCAVGCAVLDVIDEDNCMNTSHEQGTFFIKELRKLQDEFEVIGDVRGKGLMIGMELVSDRETRKALPASDVLEIWEDCKDMGLLIGKGGHYGNVFRVKPPMCISSDDVRFGIAVLRRAFQNYKDKRK